MFCSRDRAEEAAGDGEKTAATAGCTEPQSADLNGPTDSPDVSESTTETGSVRTELLPNLSVLIVLVDLT